MQPADTHLILRVPTGNSPHKFQVVSSSPTEASDLIPKSLSSISNPVPDTLPYDSQGKPSSRSPVPFMASALADQRREGCDDDNNSEDGSTEHASRASRKHGKKYKEKFGIRKACERCRQRKNKCDGNLPCSMCVRAFQEIQNAGGICIFSSAEEMCVRNTRKPMSRTSSRHSNESKNSNKTSGPTHLCELGGLLPLNCAARDEGEKFRMHTSESPNAPSLLLSKDTNHRWTLHDHGVPTEGVGVAVAAEDSDADGWNEMGNSQAPLSSQGFFNDEWTVSPAQSSGQTCLQQKQNQLHTTFLNFHERQQGQLMPLMQPSAEDMVVDGFTYRNFNELSWLALELCEPLSSISLLFWRSLFQMDVPQWLSPRCLLACCNIQCNGLRVGSCEGGSPAIFARSDVIVAADHHRLLQLAVIVHGCSCSSGEGQQLPISRDALILLDSMIVRLSKQVLSSAKAAARGDIESCPVAPHTFNLLNGIGSSFIANPPPDFTVVTAINVFISLCCAIGCVSAFSTTPDEDYDAIMSTLAALCSRYTISLDSIRSTFPYLTNVTDINLQYSFGEEIMQNLMQGDAHLLHADSTVTKLFCCDSFVLRLLARATCFKFLERFHSHTPFLPNDSPCTDPVRVFGEETCKSGANGNQYGENQVEDAEIRGRALARDYSLAMLFGARHCMSRQLSLSQALGLNTWPTPPVFDLAAAGQHMEAIERIKKYFCTFRSIRQQNGVGSRSAATFFWFKWSLDAVSAVMLYKADATSANFPINTVNSTRCEQRHESDRDAALLLSLSSLVQEVVGLRQPMLFLMEPSAAAALTVIITIVMTQRNRSPAYEDIWKSLSMAVSSAAASSGLRWWRRLAATVQAAPLTVQSFML